MGQKNSIRVKSKTEYTIEVNDAGDTISFDLADTSLTSRLCMMYEAVDRLTQEYKEKATELDARPDEARNTLTDKDPETGEDRERVLITKNQYDGFQLLDSFYQEARAALDKFLGFGACEKIFGAKNYGSMFEDLLEQLEPHFKKMGLSMENVKHSAAAKHAPNRQTRRALE